MGLESFREHMRVHPTNGEHMMKVQSKWLTVVHLVAFLYDWMWVLKEYWQHLMT